MFADVVLPIPLNKALTYRVPDGVSVEAGMRVAAPLGRRVLTGVVVKVHAQLPEPARSVKTLVKVLDEIPALLPELLKLGQWMSDYYRCSWGEALTVMLPALYKPVGREKVRLLAAPAADPPPSRVAAQLLERLAAGPQARRQLLSGLPAAAVQALAELQQAGVVGSEIKLPKRRAAKAEIAAPRQGQPSLALNVHQAEALRQIVAALEERRYSGLLLHGVTGSGKTEVYLQAVAHALSQSRGAILLVPEIALTPQMCERVAARFGNQVAVLHSRLSAGERAQAWSRIRSGEAAIALGARSAIFAPVQQLGLIVVDEEPESSYKQGDTPRYHARDLAAVRARAQGAVLVMGSATPSVESYYNALHERYRLLRLPERVDHKRLPEVRLIDLGRELDNHGRVPLFSQALLGELALQLERREQSILFLNRRGYAPLVMCPACRHILTCPDCSVALVFHQQGDVLRCHTCGRTMPARPACPKCGNACVRLVGAGTQRVEEELANYFPAARVLRLDQDSTRRRGALVEVLEKFGRQEADILLGTQMVAKGIDFPGVTLVGILAADMALQLPDFRAEERTFQLLVQVAGRAGRGGQPGLVLVQTLNAGHPIMHLAQQQDYEAFYKREISQREDLRYPPFARLASLIVRSEQGKAARKQAETIAQRLRRSAQSQDIILGPAPAPRERIAKEERFVILLKSATVKGRAQVLDALQGLKLSAGVKLTVDIDPQDLL